MTEPTSDAAYEAEPRRQRGLGRSPLGRVPQQGRSVLDALVAHDAWVSAHPGELRGRRAGDAHLPERVEPVAPVVAVEVERASPDLALGLSATQPVSEPERLPLSGTEPESEPDDDLADTGPLTISGLGVDRPAPRGSVMERLRAMRDERGMG